MGRTGSNYFAPCMLVGSQSLIGLLIGIDANMLCCVKSVGTNIFIYIYICFIVMIVILFLCKVSFPLDCLFVYIHVYSNKVPHLNQISVVLSSTRGINLIIIC
jgi:hypothetical protein